MGIEYLIIRVIFLVTGIAILLYRFNSATIKDDNGRFKYNSTGGAVLLILVAITLILNEIEKIIEYKKYSPDTTSFLRTVYQIPHPKKTKKTKPKISSKPLTLLLIR
jgi:predicted tellurium resistance membrane protein TerC